MTNSLADFRELFADLGKRTALIETRLETGNEAVVKLLEKIILTDTDCEISSFCEASFRCFCSATEPAR